MTLAERQAERDAHHHETGAPTHSFEARAFDWMMRVDTRPHEQESRDISLELLAGFANEVRIAVLAEAAEKLDNEVPTLRKTTGNGVAWAAAFLRTHFGGTP